MGKRPPKTTADRFEEFWQECLAPHIGPLTPDLIGTLGESLCDEVYRAIWYLRVTSRYPVSRAAIARMFNLKNSTIQFREYQLLIKLVDMYRPRVRPKYSTEKSVFKVSSGEWSASLHKTVECIFPRKRPPDPHIEWCLEQPFEKLTEYEKPFVLRELRIQEAHNALWDE